MALIPDNIPKSVILTPQSHCEECRYGVQSMLRKVQGVYSIAVNADRNTITITGSSAPKELLETLLKVSQDAEFCIKPPPHVPPSSCPANMPHGGSVIRTCPNPNAGCCGFTGRGRVAPCYYSYYSGHGRF